MQRGWNGVGGRGVYSCGSSGYVMCVWRAGGSKQGAVKGGGARVRGVGLGGGARGGVGENGGGLACRGGFGSPAGRKT